MVYDPTQLLAETTAFAYRNAGTWELFSTTVTTPLNGPFGSTQSYGCTNGNQSQLWTWTLAGNFNAGDITGFYRPTSGEVWMGGGALDSNGVADRIQLFNSSNACPFPNGEPTWSTCTWTIPGADSLHQMDFVRLVYNESDDEMWALWSQPTGNHIQRHLAVAGPIPFTCSGTFSIYYDDVCSDPNSRSLDTPSGVWDSAGAFMHIAAPDNVSLLQMHTSFSLLGGTHFTCNYDNIGNWSEPSGTCDRGVCPGFPTYELGGPSNCIREAIQPTIDTDRAGNFDNLIVTYSTPGSGPVCSHTSETRAYRSTDAGHTWSLQLITGCQNSIQPTVAFAHTPGYPFDVAGRFHIGSTYAYSGSDDLYTVDWASTDDGVTWSGAAIAGPRVGEDQNTPSCFAGDYNGVGADNQNDQMFFNWGQYIGNDMWAVQGIVNAE